MQMTRPMAAVEVKVKVQLCGEFRSPDNLVSDAPFFTMDPLFVSLSQPIGRLPAGPQL